MSSVLITVNVTDYSEYRWSTDYSEWGRKGAMSPLTEKVTLPRRNTDYSERQGLVLKLDVIQRIDALQITNAIKLGRAAVNNKKDRSTALHF